MKLMNEKICSNTWSNARIQSRMKDYIVSLERDNSRWYSSKSTNKIKAEEKDT